MALAAPPDAHLGRRAGTLALGLVLVAVGVAFTIEADLGVAPYDVLTTGLAETTGMEIGLAAMLLPAVFVVLGLALGGRVGPGTLIAVLAVGPILGVALDALETPDPMAARLTFFALGFLTIVSGITIMVIAGMGPGPAELLTLAVHDRGVAIAPARTAIELACVLVGWALGGQVGAGTLVFAFGVGPALRWGLERAGYDHARATEVSDCAAPGA